MPRPIIGRLRTLAAERAGDLAQVLGQGLPFDGWALILSGSEATPMGGIFVRLHYATADAPRSVRPTYWNSGPGAIMRQAEITPKSPLHGPLALLKRGALVVVSGNFFPGDNGGPFYKIGTHRLPGPGDRARPLPHALLLDPHRGDPRGLSRASLPLITTRT